MACTFEAKIDGKFAPLISLSDDDMDIDIMIITSETAVAETASEMLGKESRRKKLLVTRLFSTFVDVVVVLLFYVHGKHLRSWREGQLT